MQPEQIYERTLNKWKLSPRGIVIYNHDELSVYRLALLLCQKVLAKNPKANILIILPTEYNINMIAAEIAMDYTLASVSDYIKVIHCNYTEEVFLNRVIPETTLLITINSDKFIVDNKVQFPKWMDKISYDYLLAISTNYDCTRMYPGLPVVENITKQNITIDSKTDVIQYNVPITLTEKEQEIYKEYTDFITDTLGIFGDIQMIYNCTSREGLTYREQIAASKGWHRELDLTSPYDADVHRYFSPSALYERCSTFTNILNSRARLIQNTPLKLTQILHAVRNNPNAKIGIVNRNANHALEVTELINTNFKSNLKTIMFPSEIDNLLLKGICVNFNNTLESIELTNVTTKSGKPKIIGETIQNKTSNKYFKEGHCNIVSFSNSIPEYADFRFDIIIFTSPDCNTLLDIHKKVVNFKLNDQGIIIYLYCSNTKEENEMEKTDSLSKNRIITCINVWEIQK